MAPCKACPRHREHPRCETCDHAADPVCLTTLVLDAVRAHAMEPSPTTKAALREALVQYQERRRAC